MAIRFHALSNSTALEDWQCCICHADDRYKSIIFHNANNTIHAFHEECLLEWLKEKNICPLCNRTVNDDIYTHQELKEKIRKNSIIITGSSIIGSVTGDALFTIYLNRSLTPYLCVKALIKSMIASRMISLNLSRIPLRSFKSIHELANTSYQIGLISSIAFDALFNIANASLILLLS